MLAAIALLRKSKKEQNFADGKMGHTGTLNEQTRDIRCDPVFQQACNRFKKCEGRESSELNADETVCFDHQVAGHTKEVIASFKHMVLKPRLKSDLFIRELSFYEAASKSDPHSMRYPLTFLPEYHGSCTHANSCDYIALGDLTRAFKRPCVMDVKMGTQTFEPTASPEKRARELEKYSYQKEVGFRITGFKTYDVNMGAYSSVEKTFGRSLIPTDIQEALKKFFFNGREVRIDVITVVIQKLDNLLRWFNLQRAHHFYCSSLLIVYEGRMSQGNASEVNQWSSPPVDAAELVQVKMIDFAHTLAVSTGKVDEGYTHGLGTLINHLQAICGTVNSTTASTPSTR